MKKKVILSLMICMSICLGMVTLSFAEDSSSDSVTEGKIKPKHPHKKMEHKAKRMHKKHKQHRKERKQNNSELMKDDAQTVSSEKD